MPDTLNTHSQDSSNLVLSAVTKVYPGGFKLGPVDIVVSGGTTIGIMGRNGAGKTTLFQLITGNSDATAGKISFGNHPMSMSAHELKKQIGYLPQDAVLPAWSTVDELLRYACSLYQLATPKRLIETSLETWDCQGFKDRPISRCSYGMQKRIGLALATIHQPKLLILDEPFSGLDLFHVRALEDLLKSRSKSGASTIISTHVPSHLALIADQLLLVRDGKVENLQDWSKSTPQARVEVIERSFFA